MSAPARTANIEDTLDTIARRAKDPRRNEPDAPNVGIAFDLVQYLLANPTPQQWTRDMQRCIQALVDSNLVDNGLHEIMSTLDRAYGTMMRINTRHHLGVTTESLDEWLNHFLSPHGILKHDIEAFHDLCFLASFQFGTTLEEGIQLYQAVVVSSPRLQQMEVYQGRLLLALIDLHVNVTMGKGGASVPYLEQQIMRLATTTDAPKQLFQVSGIGDYSASQLFTVLAKYRVVQVEGKWENAPLEPTNIKTIREVVPVWSNGKDNAITLLHAILVGVDNSNEVAKRIRFRLVNDSWFFPSNAWVIHECVKWWVAHRGRMLSDHPADTWPRIMQRANVADWWTTREDREIRIRHEQRKEKGMSLDAFINQKRRDVRDMSDTFRLLVANWPHPAHGPWMVLPPNTPDLSFQRVLAEALEQDALEQQALAAVPPALVGQHKEFIKSLMDTDAVDALIPDLMAIISTFGIGGEETKINEEGNVVQHRTPFGRIVDKDARTFYNEERGRRDEAAALASVQQALLPVRRMLAGRPRDPDPDETESDEDAMEDDESEDDEPVSKKTRTDGRMYVY